MNQDQINIVKQKGWIQDGEFWTHAKRTFTLLRFMFTFDQVLKIEGIE